MTDDQLREYEAWALAGRHEIARELCAAVRAAQRERDSLRKDLKTIQEGKERRVRRLEDHLRITTAAVRHYASGCAPDNEKAVEALCLIEAPWRKQS